MLMGKKQLLIKHLIGGLSLAVSNQGDGDARRFISTILTQSIPGTDLASVTTGSKLRN
jgi:hypothetical protein